MRKIYNKIITLVKKLTLPERKRLIDELYIDLYFELYDQNIEFFQISFQIEKKINAHLEL